jgi:hypothetical protein
MTAPATAYNGALITFATMHHKERLARAAFRNILGATVTAPSALDTDQFGTFAGEIPRTLSARAAARAKARLGMQLAATDLGLASEGSFSSAFGPLVENTEILLFIDDARGIELIEGQIGVSPLPGGRRIHGRAEALAYAEAVGFPRQGVIVQSTADGTMTAHKGLGAPEQLEATVDALLADSASVVIMPDYRAHKSPSRARTIAALCNRMARRLATACPQCATPGFGQIDVEHGVPCSLCGAPTQVIRADIHGCGRCEHRTRVSRGLVTADPQRRDACNP